MQRVNMYLFLLLGDTFHRLASTLDRPLNAGAHQIARSLNGFLEILLQGTMGFQLKESAGRARDLQGWTAAIVQKHEQDNDATLSDDEKLLINQSLTGLNSALSLELANAPIFAVEPQGVFDMTRLIDQADSVFVAYADRLPGKTLDEAQSAGRCLAFSLPTAGAFHIARATEAVLVAYTKAFSCYPSKKSARNVGNYIKNLRATEARSVVLDALDHWRSLHRNPLIHPESTLTIPQADVFMATCWTLIQSMVADMETRLDDPRQELIDMLPPVEKEEATS